MDDPKQARASLNAFLLGGRRGDHRCHNDHWDCLGLRAPFLQVVKMEILR
jgi:hypothetical protein